MNDPDASTMIWGSCRLPAGSRWAVRSPAGSRWAGSPRRARSRWWAGSPPWAASRWRAQPARAQAARLPAWEPATSPVWAYRAWARRPLQPWACSSSAMASFMALAMSVGRLVALDARRGRAGGEERERLVHLVVLEVRLEGEEAEHQPGSHPCQHYSSREGPAPVPSESRISSLPVSPPGALDFRVFFGTARRRRPRSRSLR